MTNKTACNTYAKAHLFKELSFIIVRDPEGYRASLSMSHAQCEFFQVFRRLVRMKQNQHRKYFCFNFSEIIFFLEKDFYLELSYIDHK